MLPGQMSTWLLESVQDVPRNLSLKFHHNQVLRYSWYGQMSRGQKLPGQMLPLQLESVLDVCRNLPLKFHQNRVSNSWDIADIEFMWWWWWWVVVCKVIFMSNPTVVLRLGWGFDNIRNARGIGSLTPYPLPSILRTLTRTWHDRIFCYQHHQVHHHRHHYHQQYHSHS